MKIESAGSNRMPIVKYEGQTISAMSINMYNNVAYNKKVQNEHQYLLSIYC